MEFRFVHTWPRLARALAVILFLSVSAALVISYRSLKRTARPPGQTFPDVRFGQRVISVTQGIRHLQTEGNRHLFLLTASRDELYDDDHHELKDVALEVYDANNQPHGWVEADTAVYEPSQRLVTFRDGVVARTWDGLSLKTERLVYNQSTQIITAPQSVAFERNNLKGTAAGAELLTQRDHEQVVLKGGVQAHIGPSTGPKTVPVRIDCDTAVYRKSDAALHLEGGVLLAQAEKQLMAYRMVASFGPQDQLQRLEAQGQALLESNTEGRETQVRADRMDFSFDEGQRLRLAVAVGNATANVSGPHQRRDLRAPRIEAEFALAGPTSYPLSRLTAGDRAEVRFSPSRATTTASEKTLTARAVELLYHAGGQTPERAVASGDAVLVLPPSSTDQRAERKTIHADRMDIEFYDDGSLAKTFNAAGQVRVEFAPLAPGPDRQVRTTTSQRLTAQIDRHTQEISQLTQSGRFRFTEGDRHATSERATYDAAAQTISLRDGAPQVWDGRGRTRAKEIDLNLETDESVGRGQVMTTYSNRQATGNAVPFEKSGAPIFVAADRAEVNHDPGLAVYTGRARAWQEDHYVTGRRIELYRAEKKMVAIGQVQAVFVQSPSGKDAESNGPTPVFVSAEQLTYQDLDRLARCETGARLRWKTEQVTADVITVFLKPDVNELDHAVANGHVVVTEPERRAYGEQVEYTAADERLVLTGAPARVEDDRQQTTQRGPRLTFLRGSDKVFVGEQASSQGVKSVRKIQ